jgi:hypothetical protein
MNTLEELKSVSIPEGVELTYGEIVNGIHATLSSLFPTAELTLESYSGSKKGDVASGTICYGPIGIHWTHSYNKTLKFTLSLVLYGKKTDTLYTSHEVIHHQLFKKSPSNSQDLKFLLESIEAELKDGKSVQNLKDLRTKFIDEKYIDEGMVHYICGELFFGSSEFLTPQQASNLQSILIQKRKEGEYINGYWELFVALLESIKDSHPKIWLSQNRELSKILYNWTKSNTSSPAVIVSTPEAVEENTEEITPEEKRIEETPVEEESISANETEEMFEEAANYMNASLKKTPVIETPKKGLGLFSKLSQKVTSENTGKTKKVLIPETKKVNDEIIEEEREDKAEKSAKLVDSELEETLSETVEQVVEETDLVDSELEDELDSFDSVETFEEEEFDSGEEEFENESEEEEECLSKNIPYINDYNNGEELESIKSTENSVIYYYPKNKLTVVIDKKNIPE